MTIIWIILGVIVFLALWVVVAKWAAREARRVTREVDFRVDSVNTLMESIFVKNDDEATKLERQAARLKARAEEVASRKTPLW